jgi:AP-2 complex subunit alpha
VSGLPDESEFVLYGAASLRTGSTTPTGEKISVGCLVKIEMNVQSNAIRVTTRALHPQASIAVMATAKALLV